MTVSQEVKAVVAQSRDAMAGPSGQHWYLPMVDLLERILDAQKEGLDPLPEELQKSFYLMRGLDSKVQDLLKEIDKESYNYIDNTANLTPSKRREATDKIGKMYTRVKELADTKVQLAMTTYETVDKHIRRLDTELVRFENKLKGKLLSKTGKATATGAQGVREKRKRDSRKRTDSGMPGGQPRQRKKSKNTTTHDLVEPDPMLLPSLQSMTNGGDVMDMPVDPNEPTYCLCHQVSYGEMIGCDNPECPIEWFHFACVGLNTKPKGRWYCPKCGPPPTAEKKRK
ncbi:inhibitor of growth protein 4-like [Tropilaelaps mercedesae]|uniref:Inhibitor of growth protein n=1 Tax=Tropilaelaps mercedesae TaxID=418985 RepID=A0A1V9XC94_9ACAR|nr:inhibitor of growth protein 4-like [Tropilaelaps mercedesae]